MIINLQDREVAIKGGEYFIADNATVVGSVEIANNVSIWFNTVIRGDMGLITIGEESNIQDSCVLHTHEGLDLNIGRRVTVGHKAVLHGCTVGDDCLIGINAVVLNGSVIGKNCLIGACSLITEDKVIPDNSVVLGSPGKVVREISDSQMADIKEASEHYVKNFKKYIKSGTSSR